jgi:hypothetical protein
MTPTRLVQCLGTIRWTSLDLADALECDVSLVEAWLEDYEEIPARTAAWIETLATVHAAAEAEKPTSLKGKRFKGIH